MKCYEEFILLHTRITFSYFAHDDSSTIHHNDKMDVSCHRQRHHPKHHSNIYLHSDSYRMILAIRLAWTNKTWKEQNIPQTHRNLPQTNFHDCDSSIVHLISKSTLLLQTSHCFCPADGSPFPCLSARRLALASFLAFLRSSLA